ncbi:MAG: hypothetical protein COA82_01135 [Alkaliphilus sp.]|nr:hypothetical protein [bacterium AH-315-E09]PHS36598.1 MAG: hypothetical protein COA82_01135 [Alkaliphilus sp.]
MGKYAKLLGDRRAFSYQEFLETKFPFKEYKNYIDPGEYIATLKIKTWGKNLCLHCYFLTENKEKVRLTVFSANSRGIPYSPTKGSLDMSDENIKIGNVFCLKIGKSKSGKTVWEKASFCED